MTPKASNRSEWVDYAKGLAIFGVIFNHSVYNVSETGILPPATWWNERLWLDFEPILRVAIFFFLVGAFIERSLNKAGTKSFLVTRAQTLLYPYVIWQTISIFRSSLSHHWTFRDYLPIFLQMPFHGFQQFWFVLALMQMILFYVLCRTLRMSRNWIAALCFGIYFLPVDISFAQREFATLQNMLPYFALGLLLAEYKQALGAYRGFWMPLTGILLLGVALLNQANSWSMQPPGRLVWNLVTMAGFIMVASFCAHFHRFQLFRLMGFYSLEVYCLHVLAGGLVRVLLVKMGVTGFWPLVGAVMAASIAIPLAVGICDRRYNWRLFRWQKLKPKAAVETPPAVAEGSKKILSHLL